METFYHSFLLRIWKNNIRNYNDWHASLEDPSTHALIAFNHPEELFAYLLMISELNKDKPQLEEKE